MAIEIVTNNKKLVLSELKNRVLNALEICGAKAESYAKADAPVDTGFLRNSVAHLVDDEKLVMYVGTNTHYAPYIEFGTGIHYEGGRRTSWVYEDSKGEWHRTNGMEARPFIKPSIAKHEDEYKDIIENELKG